MQSKAQSKARALTRIATPETDAELVNLARAGTTAHIETVVRACRRYGPKEELDHTRRQHLCRYLEVSHDDDGMVLLRARLEPLAAAVVLRALDAAAEKLYRKSRAVVEVAAPPGGSPSATGSSSAPDSASSCSSPSSPPPAERRSACRDAAGNELAPAQRRADALVLVAESALAGGLDPGASGDRYQVVLHVDAPVLADPTEPGISATVVMAHAPDGSILDVGRRTRTISPALRRALLRRDGGCRFPGCGLAMCDAHHVRHWADGGVTSLDNTLLLCRFHHRLVHEEGFQLKLLPSGEAQFRRPDGRLLSAVPALPPLPGVDPALAIAKRISDGVIVGPYTGTPTWDGTPVDLSVAVDWFLAVTSKSSAKAIDT